MTFPNLITLLRVVLIPLFVSLIFYQKFGWALLTFFVAGVSDAIDGAIARTFNQSSELGKILDPIADKLLMTTAFVVLSLPTIVSGENLPIPFWLTAAVIARDVLIISVAGAIFVATEFRGFRPSFWGKASTLVQVISVGLILVAAAFQQFAFYLPFIYFTVFVFAAISGIHYIFFVNKLIKQQNPK
ncbi:MAG: CDP-alcohol phosphatidyltransferase family protein [Acidobacteriota bacterium]|nr:CDP-alcohol phosphatidyltransferase family protein [Acidobacteriota bacterium]